MSKELHWGGINVKSLCKAILSDLWMVLAVMIITYLGLGIAGRMSTPLSYTSDAVVAVYPFDRMYTLETSSSALETVSAVSQVFNSEMFKTGLENRLTELEDFSIYSEQIDSTYILMLSASGSSPENAYQVLRTALDYYGEISAHLVGNSHLEILTEPDFPTSGSNNSKILKYQLILTLFMGFAMAGFLVLVYVMRRTYKTASTIRSYYKNVRFFLVKDSSERQSCRNRKKSGSVPNQEVMRKTALQLLQMLRAKNGNSIFVTSAAAGDGKTNTMVSLAREMANFGRSILIIETDPENSEIAEQFGMSDDLQRYMLSDLLQDGFNLDNAAIDIPDQSFKVVFANKINTQDVSPYTEKDIERILEQVEKFADIILVDGCIWTGSRGEKICKEAADTSLAVCKEDTAEFYKIDRMMVDLQDSNTDFLGCVLYGF